MRVLVIEDDTTLGHALQEFLADQGYAVDWLTEGDRVLGALAGQPYDLMLLDLNLPPTQQVRTVTLLHTDPLLYAAVQATEEAIVNALIAAETMTGINGNRVHAIPHRRLQRVLRKYNRLTG